MPDQKAKELRKYEKSLPISLLRAREATTRYFKPFIDQHDLTMPQWRVMRALAEEEGLDARTLSERCVILPPSLTRIFRSLTQRGLISQVDCTDARRHRVTLTNAGRALFEEVMEESEPHYQRLAAAFGAERLDSLMNLLSELRDTVEDLNAEDAREITLSTRKMVAAR